MKHLSDTFSVWNSPKQGDVIWALFSNFALKCVRRDVKANPEGLKLQGPHYLWSGKRGVFYLLRRREVDVSQRMPGFDPRSAHVTGFSPVLRHILQAPYSYSVYLPSIIIIMGLLFPRSLCICGSEGPADWLRFSTRS
jgi:hypothetical protein